MLLDWEGLDLPSKSVFERVGPLLTSKLYISFPERAEFRYCCAALFEKPTPTSFALPDAAPLLLATCTTLPRVSRPPGHLPIHYTPLGLTPSDAAPQIVPMPSSFGAEFTLNRGAPITHMHIITLLAHLHDDSRSI